MKYDKLEAEDLYDLSFDELVTMAKEKPQLTANFMWQLLWGPWVPQRVVNEVDGEVVAIEMIDDPGAVVAQMQQINSKTQPNKPDSKPEPLTGQQVYDNLKEMTPEQIVQLEQKDKLLGKVARSLYNTKMRTMANKKPNNWTLSDGMRQTLQGLLSATTDLAETDKPNRGRWEKEKLRLERLLEVKPKNESGKPSKSSPTTSAQRSYDTKSALGELQYQRRLIRSQEVQQSRRSRLEQALEAVEYISGRSLEHDERERVARNLEETWAQRRSVYLKAARSKTSTGRLSLDERADLVKAFWEMVDGEIAHGEVNGWDDEVVDDLPLRF